MITRTLAVALAAFPLLVHASVDSVEVNAVIAAVNAKNPDTQALCQSGKDGIKQAVSEAVKSLYFDGKIKGDPRAVGTEAGQRIMFACRDK